MPEEEVAWLDALDKDKRPVSIHPDDRARAEAEGYTIVTREPINLPARFPHPHQMKGSDYVDALSQGLSSGLSDELSAAGRAFMNAARGKYIRPKEQGGGFADDYSQYHKQENSAMERAARSHPGVTGALNIAGGLVQARILPGLALATKGASLGRRVLSGMAQGGAEGVISGGASATGDMADRAKGAAWGGGIGAAAGALMPVAGAGARELSQGVVNALPDWAAGLGKLFPRVRVPGQDAVHHKILEKLQKDGLSLEGAEALVRKYQAAGTPITLADLGGENMATFAKAAMTPSTSGKTPAWEYLRQRAGGARDRIRGYISDAASETGEHLNPGTKLDMNDPFETVSKAAIASRAAAAQPAYARAFQEAAAAGLAVDDELVSFLQKPQFKSAYRAAYKDSLLEGPRLPQIYDRKGMVVPEKLTLETLDAIKQVIGDKVYAGSNPISKNALLPKRLGSYRRVLHAYTEKLKAIAPESYREALAQYSDASKLLDAAKQGRKFATMNEAQLGDVLHGMNGAEREHFLLGAVDDLRKTLKGPHGADYVKRVFDGGNRELALSQLFSKPGAFEVFKEKMMNEAKLRRTYDHVRGNSTTVSQSEALQDLGSDGYSDILQQITSLRPDKAIGSLITRGQGVRGRNAEAAVPLLFNQNPLEVLGLLRQTKATLDKTMTKPSKVGLATGVGAGLLTTKTPTDEKRRRQ